MPGFLGTWTDAGQAAQFDEGWAWSMGEARWCCSSWGPHDEEYRTLNYAYPQLFKGGPVFPFGALSYSLRLLCCGSQGCAPTAARLEFTLPTWP